MRRGAQESEVIGQRGKATGPVSGQFADETQSRNTPVLPRPLGGWSGSARSCVSPGDVDDLRIAGIYLQR